MTDYDKSSKDWRNKNVLATISTIDVNKAETLIQQNGEKYALYHRPR